MDKYQDEFDEIENAAAEKRQMQDFADQQNEYAGNNVGRAQRFLTADGNNLIAGKNKGKNSNGLSTFDLLMLDSAYANLYSNAISQLGDAERATETAIEKWTAIAAQTRTDLSDTLDRAYQLDNGLHVFRDDQGEIWDENDQFVDDSIADTIEWSGFEPSREEFLQRRTADQEAQTTVSELLIYQTDVLGAARERLTDTDNPLSMDDLNAELQTISDQMPDASRFELPQSVSSANMTQSFDVSAPQL